jgi:uncharacterized protein (DUF2384 family)
VSQQPKLEKVLGREVIARIVGEGPSVAERGEKLRCVWENLLDLYDARRAVQWLQSPASGLAGRSPLQVLPDPDGLDRVLEAISRLTWGLPE